MGKLKPTQKECNDEDKISEKLCLILGTMWFKEKYDIDKPRFQLPIEPKTEDELKGGKKNTIPDFTCNITNPNPNTYENHEIPLHVECKRLGKTKGSPALNKKYVENGIKRFDTASHEYGKRASSGMMIGYIINMKRTDILAGVNKYLNGYIPQLSFTFSQNINSCEQSFSRKHVKPNKFKLIHIWVDLRKPICS